MAMFSGAQPAKLPSRPSRMIITAAALIAVILALLIRNRPGCSVTWLHERLGLTHSGAVRLIDRLQELGLVSRARTAGRREVSLSISLRGEAVAGRGVSARGQAIESQLDGLPAADRDELLSLIERLLRAQARPRDEGDVACRL